MRKQNDQYFSEENKMSKIEKVITIVVSIFGTFGGLAGLWGAYTAYDASKFKEPFVKHSELANSFKDQIGSAENRQDNEEVNRVRLEYEKFEESWRDTQYLAAIVAPIENLANIQLSDEELEKVEKLVASVKSEQPASEDTFRTLGSAYFALGRHEEAIKQYNMAATLDPEDPSIYALKAASYAQLSVEDSDESEKAKNEKSAVESLRKAASLYKNKERLSEYFSANKSLRNVVANGDKELARQLTMGDK
jgi:tetratricopeptide (TPR) repeat protein